MLDVKFQYAILILNAIGKAKGAPIKLKDLAKEHKVSIYFLAQVSRSLRIRKLIKSKKGPGGGYIQAKKPITVLDVNEALYIVKEKQLCAKDEQGRKSLMTVNEMIRSSFRELRLL
jgi:Rrf2 family protein